MERTYRTWFKSFEREDFLRLLDLNNHRYLMDLKIRRRKVVLNFARSTKSPSGVDLIDTYWDRSFTINDACNRLGIGKDRKHITHGFVFMGEVQIWFRKEEK